MNFLWILSGLVSLLAACYCVQGDNEKTWTCPYGWNIYDDDDPMQCVVLGNGTTSTMMQAHNVCVSLNASLIMITTEKKFQFLNGFLKNHTQNKFWLGVLKFHDGIKWLTRNGQVYANLPKSLKNIYWSESTYNNERKGILIDGYGSMYSKTSHYSIAVKYICERRPDCKPGWYGTKCDQACHCHGQPCDPKDLHGVCLHGCQLGWMGPSCNKKKENAHVNYYCIKSKDKGKYVHIRINTKEVPYHKIQPVDNLGNWIDWSLCENTSIFVDLKHSIRTIKIFIDNKTEATIRNGSCAGQVTEGVFGWHIKLEEKENFVSRNDQEFTISCDFSDADTLTMSGNTELGSGVSHFNKLDVKKENVDLRVVDAFTGLPLNKTVIGTSVVLKIRFGLGPENEATAVSPYDCDVSSEDGSHKVKLLDGAGCPVAKSIISSFSMNGTNESLITDPFPMPGFAGTKNVYFHCSYRLCFDHEQCTVKCQKDNENSFFSFFDRSHHRRSIRDVSSRLTGSVQLDMPFKLTRHTRSSD